MREGGRSPLRVVVSSMACCSRASEDGHEGANDVAAVTFNAAVDLLYDATDDSSRQSKETGAVSLLEECQRILGDETPSCCKVASKRCRLLAQVFVLHGRIVEWKDPGAALNLYQAAVSVSSGDSAEALLHLGRLSWKLASTQEELDRCEGWLKQARHRAAGGVEDDEDTYEEAGKLLGRLLCQSPGRRREACNYLSSLGFSFSLSADLTSAEDPATAGRVASLEECRGMVSVEDDAFDAHLLAHLQDLFSPESEFWKDHDYGSPGRGFFSYQNVLPLEEELQQPTPSSTFEEILRHIRNRAAAHFPQVRGAKYAEWWAHNRPHSNGHSLHFDYVLGKDGESRHPLVSCISFLDASCGGPTLVLDQTMSNEICQSGRLLVPKANRLACFNGNLLHCVLPGAGLVPGGDSGKRRTTFMVAFYKDDPGAPVMPKREYRIGTKRAKWPAKFSQLRRRATNVKPRPRNDFDATNVRLIEPVFESVAAMKGSKKKRRRLDICPGIDLLDEGMFSFFGALDSGLLIASRGDCSLNCGGKCPACRGGASSGNHPLG